MLLYINLAYLIHYGVLILVRDYSSYGNLREVIQESRYCGKFFDVVPLKRCGKGQIEFARESLSGRSTGWEWSGGRGGAGRSTGLILMVLVGGRASVRNGAETFGLERELMGRWENLTTRGGTSLTLSPNSVSHRYRL